MNRGRYFPVLDGLRGLAIIGVLLTHAAVYFQAHGAATRWFLPVMQFGQWGVDLFFVLSGFLITGILLDTRTAINRERSFYGRRVLRIFPVYYLALGLVLFVQPHWGWLRTAASLQTPAEYLSYLFYFQNWLPLFNNGGAPNSLVGHFWSLAVEEQFYLVWPVIVWHLSARAIARLCLVALLVTLVVRILLVAHFGSDVWVYRFTITRADGLYVGSALAVIYAVKGHVPKRLMVGLVALGGAALAIIALFGPARQIWLTGTQMSMIGISGVALLSGASVIFCLQSDETSVAKLLKQRWLRTFGKYSYGMYVWHFPIYYGMQHLLEEQSFVFPLPTVIALPFLGVIIAVSFMAAWMSFNFYEQWFLQLKVHFQPVFLEQNHSDSPDGDTVRDRDGRGVGTETLVQA
jgi:peptidoglycan/LPS O-acetylase OafA/YrhL